MTIQTYQQMPTSEKMTRGFTPLDPDQPLEKRPYESGSSVQKLMELGDLVVKKYITSIRNFDNSRRGKQHFYDETYGFIHSFLKKSGIDSVEYTESDLTGFVFASVMRYHDEHEKIAFGLYTGVLLERLTRQSNGKDSIVHISDVEMDYLFYHARVFDKIILENCSGHNVLGYACNGAEGRGRLVAVKGFKGSYLLDSAVNYSGRLDLVLARDIGQEAEDISSDASFFDLANNGRLDAIICENIRGTNTFSFLGTNSGNVKLLAAHYIFGSGIARCLGLGGNVDTVQFYDVYGQEWENQMEVNIFLDRKSHTYSRSIAETPDYGFDSRFDGDKFLEMLPGLSKASGHELAKGFLDIYRHYETVAKREGWKL